MAKQQTSKTNDSSARFNADELRERGRAAFNQFGDQASSQIESMPLVALVGGLALGALIASVLPQTDREADLLEPVGSKVADAGRSAVDKAREAGKSKVDELAGDKLREFFGFSSPTSETA